MTGLESFVANNPFWAYAIIFGGMFIEGDLIFLLAAIFAWQGQLNWSIILGVILGGAVLGDILWYSLGKYVRSTKLGFLLTVRFSTYHEWLDKNFMSRYSRMAFFAKFMYYINRLTPLIAGWQGLAFKKFFKIHFFAGCLWVAVMGILTFTAGYFVGPEGARWLVRKMEWVIIGSLVLFIGGEYLLKKIFSKKIGTHLNNNI